MIINPPDEVKAAVEDGTARITRRCEVYYRDGKTLWYPENNPELAAKMAGGANVGIDATRDERRSFDVTFVNSDGSMTPSSNGGFWYDKILKPFKGVELLDGTTWEAPLGVFLPDGFDEDSFPGHVKVTCRDRTKLMMGSKFAASATFPATLKLGEFVANLAANAGIDEMRIPSNTPAIGVDVQVERGTARWDIARDTALSKSYQIYFDNDGYMVLAPLPDPAFDPIEITFKTGPDGNLSSWTKSSNEGEVFNHIVVVGEREGEDGTLPFFGEAINEDPASPTSVQNIGHRMKEPIVLATMASNAECERLAQSLLKVAGLESYTFNGVSIAYPWMETNLVAEVLLPEANPGDPTRYLLDTCSIELGPGPMNFTAKRITVVGGTIPRPVQDLDPLIEVEDEVELPPIVTDPVTNPPTQPEPEPNPSGATVDFGIATYNIGAGGSDDAKMASFDLLIRNGADFICIQEFRNRVSMLNRWLRKNPDWGAFTGPDRRSSAVTILYRRSLGEVVVRKATLVARARHFGGRGGSAVSTGDKYVNEVGIKLSNNRVVQVHNTHQIPAATKSKKELGPTEYAKRRSFFSEQTAGLNARIDACQGFAFATGDFNAEPGFELLVPFFNRMTMDHNFDTRFNRRIDIVAHRNHNGLTVVTAKEMSNVASDHDAVIVIYRAKAA